MCFAFNRAALSRARPSAVRTITGMDASFGILELLLPELVTVHHRHHDVEEDDVDAVRFPQRVQGNLAVLRRPTAWPSLSEDVAEGFGRGRVVIDQEDSQGRLPFPSAARRRTPRRDLRRRSTPMRPPCAETICRAIHRPRPRPPNERSDTPRSNCSKMRSRSAGLDAEPVVSHGDASRTSSPSRFDRHLDRAAAAELDGVGEEVRDDLVEGGPVPPSDERRRARTLRCASPPSRHPPASARRRRRTSSDEVRGAELGREASGRDPRDVQKTVRQVRKPVDLVLRFLQLFPVRRAGQDRCRA